MNGYGPHAHMFRQMVKGLRFGAPRSYEGLCVLPLLSATESLAEYVLLGEALSRGALTITEINETGFVHYLTAVNEGPWPVLIFDGEELVGAMHNRISNATILVGVGKSALPVSCVKQGRWGRRSAALSSRAYAAHPGLTMEKESLVRSHATAVTAEVRGSTRVEPQEERAARFCGAQAGELDDYVGALDFADDDTLTQAVGAMVFLEGRFVCADLLQPAERFGRLYPRLLRGYALEALVSANKRDFFVKNGIDHLLPPGSQTRTDIDPESAALLLFAELVHAEFVVQRAVGLGEDIRLESKSVSGSGLAWNHELLQVSLFPRQAA